MKKNHLHASMPRACILLQAVLKQAFGEPDGRSISEDRPIQIIMHRKEQISIPDTEIHQSYI